MKYFNQETEAILHGEFYPVGRTKETKDGDILTHKVRINRITIYRQSWNGGEEITRAFHLTPNEIISIYNQLEVIREESKELPYEAQLPF